MDVVATSICQVNGNVKMSGWAAVKFGKPPYSDPIVMLLTEVIKNGFAISFITNDLDGVGP